MLSSCCRPLDVAQQPITAEMPTPSHLPLMQNPNAMDANPEITLARQLIENTQANVFLTGKAGTGKTTFLRRLVADSPKRNVVLAPTGIAAINAGGQTIHSFLQIPFGPFILGANYSQEQFRMSARKQKLIRSLDLLIIDEISMVRADLLDHVDAVLRRYRNRFLPFGGVQLLMIGDLQQLAPVVKDDEWALLSQHYDTPYFFSSQALRQTELVTIELQRVYRQQDEQFLHLLNAVRTNTADAKVLDALNSRYIPDFQPRPEEGYVRLVTHNYQADRINQAELERITAPEDTYRAVVNGVFPEYSYPTAERLTLKVGAQVMFVKNDSTGERRYYNGLLGVIEQLNSDGIVVQPHDGGSTIEVGRERWLNSRYALNEQSGEIEEVTDGYFEQYPLRLAWAITIHKSQGLTFERALIDASGSFAHGQTYVALSRCKSLEGLVLAEPLPARAIIQDSQVAQFTSTIAAQTPTPDRVDALQRAFFLHLVSEAFDFKPIAQQLRAYLRFLEEHAYRQQPHLVHDFQTSRTEMETSVLPVAEKFYAQFYHLIYQHDDYRTLPLLQERLTKGAAYFLDLLVPMVQRMAATPLALNNKEHLKRGLRLVDELNLLLRVKARVLHHIAHEGFHQKAYQHARAMAVIADAQSDETGGKATARKRKASTEKASKSDKPKRLSREESMAMSLALFREGKTVEEVALERGLETSTIWGHLRDAVIEGDLPLTDFVPIDMLARITHFYEQHDGEATMSEARAAIGSDVEFAQISVVKRMMERSGE